MYIGTGCRVADTVYVSVNIAWPEHVQEDNSDY